jgi:hypothetical protein
MGPAAQFIISLEANNHLLGCKTSKHEGKKQMRHAPYDLATFALPCWDEVQCREIRRRGHVNPRRRTGGWLAASALRSLDSAAKNEKYCILLPASEK